MRMHTLVLPRIGFLMSLAMAGYWLGHEIEVGGSELSKVEAALVRGADPPGGNDCKYMTHNVSCTAVDTDGEVNSCGKRAGGSACGATSGGCETYCTSDTYTWECGDGQQMKTCIETQGIVSCGKQTFAGECYNASGECKCRNGVEVDEDCGLANNQTVGLRCNPT
jgi:hypothetical protein